MASESTGAQVRIRTERFLIEGSVYVAGNGPGHRRRLSDMLNEPAEFLVMTDAQVQEVDSPEQKHPEHHETFMLR